MTVDGRLADVVASLAAIGQSLGEEFDPRRFLGPFSERLQALVPHDRLVVALLDDGGKTFRIFAEHVAHGPLLHDAHYTGVEHAAPHVVDEWRIRTVFAGEPLLITDWERDLPFDAMNRFEQRLYEAGFRAAVIVPLKSGGRVLGTLSAQCRRAHAYTDAHGAAAQQVADLIGPFIENVVLLHRERRRRRRLAALDGLPRALGESLDVTEVFHRVAEAVRPAMDFDLMGACLITESGRDVEILAEFDPDPVVPTPPRIPLDDFSFSGRVLAGDSLLIDDAPVELDPRRPGDRLIIDGGGRSVLSVPLRMGERVAGALYFGKRQPHWFDETDLEVAGAIAAHVVLAIQHQRLAEEQRRLAQVEGRARRLEARVASLTSELGERYGFEQIIGRAPALREALARAAKAAPTETTVFITGESGTGKELVARAVHHASLRADGPFVALNCAALPEALLESELFGHERGAFTGADRQKPGRFELAAGGTLFLDEVGELSPPVQAKLLRVLQEREFERLGGAQKIRADVRLIAATNRDLEREVAEGRFREDLYYRFNVFTVHLPPLRERGDDVLLLADHFARTLGTRMGKGEPGLSRDARDVLLAHAWPGNIRELQNAIERALIVSDGGLLTAAQLALAPRRDRAPATGAPAAETAGPGRSLAEWEKRMVLDALDKARGNKSRAARLLGLTRSQLYTRMKRFGLEVS